MTDPKADGRPLVVISDLHMGRPDMVATASQLDTLVDGASTLIINGDTAELQLDESSEVAYQELDRLRDRCRSSGTSLVLLAGNHDPEIVPRRHLMLAGGEVLITHGDAVHEALAPWSDASKIIARRHREVMGSKPASQRDTLETLFEACREAALAESNIDDELGAPTTILGAIAKPRKAAEILGFWLTHGWRLNRFAARFEPSARIVITGHSHRAGVQRVGGRTVINTGCFGTPGPALAVIFDDLGLEVRRVAQSRRSGSWFIQDGVVHADSGIRIRRDELPASDALQRVAS